MQVEARDTESVEEDYFWKPRFSCRLSYFEFENSIHIRISMCLYNEREDMKSLLFHSYACMDTVPLLRNPRNKICQNFFSPTVIRISWDWIWEHQVRIFWKDFLILGMILKKDKISSSENLFDFRPSPLKLEEIRLKIKLLDL